VASGTSDAAPPEEVGERLAGEGSPEQANADAAIRHAIPQLLMYANASPADSVTPGPGHLVSRRHAALDRIRRDGAREHHHGPFTVDVREQRISESLDA
jgi:hypothetical protein